MADSIYPRYLDILEKLHSVIKPQNYLEIGIRWGKSMALSKVPSIGIDPDYKLRFDFEEHIHLYKQTSDFFFENNNPTEILGDKVSMAFIDGMHLSEYTLRDFINVEAHCHKDSIIVIDDVLPHQLEHATRDRNTSLWTGDVYVIIYILKELRPDLNIRTIKTKNKGLAIISQLNPESKVLSEQYPQIEKKILDGYYNVDNLKSLEEYFNPIEEEVLISQITNEQ